MIRDDIEKLARQRMQLVIEDEYSKLRNKLASIRADMAHRGMLSSSMAAYRVANACAQAVVASLDEAWHDLKLVLDHANVSWTPELAGDIKVLLGAVHPSLVSGLKDIIDNEWHAASRPGNRPEDIEGVKCHIDNVVQAAEHRILLDVDLYVLALPRGTRTDPVAHKSGGGTPGLASPDSAAKIATAGSNARRGRRKVGSIIGALMLLFTIFGPLPISPWSLWTKRVRTSTAYDEQMGREAVDLQRQMDEFLSRMIADPTSYQSSYEASTSYYLDYEVALRSLRLRAEAQPNYAIVEKQYALMLDSLKELRSMHEHGPLVPEIAEVMRDLFNQSWAAIIKCHIEVDK